MTHALLSARSSKPKPISYDTTNKTLTVQIHHLTQAAYDQVLEKLCAALNETQTVFPGTDLTLIFKIGSSQFPAGQEV